VGRQSARELIKGGKAFGPGAVGGGYRTKKALVRGWPDDISMRRRSRERNASNFTQKAFMSHELVGSPGFFFLGHIHAYMDAYTCWLTCIDSNSQFLFFLLFLRI
jgi:hypothetical protein